MPQIRDRLSLIGIRGEMSIYFNDLVDHVEKTWQTLEEQKEVVEGLHDSTAALLNTTTNEVVRVLTVISVILLPLTLIASVFGMNIPLPFADRPFALEFILGGMLLLIIIMVVIFRKLRWL